MKYLSLRQLFGTLLCAFSITFLISFVSAWTGPTATAPGGNVAAPINVGTTDQVKDAGISVNSLAVFGSQYIQEKLGVDVLSPVVAIETPGTIKIGNGGETCQAVTEGAIRYNTTLNILNYCDGSSWVALAVEEQPSGQSFTTPGTYSFTVPNYSSMTVTIKGAGGGGGGPFNTGGPAGTSGGNSSFNGTAIAYGGGGGGAGYACEPGPYCDGGAASAAGGTGGTVTTGGGAAAGAGVFSSVHNQFPEGRQGDGGDGGAGGKVVKTYTTGDLSPGTIVTVVVGAAGGGGSSGGAGSVEIALSY